MSELMVCESNSNNDQFFLISRNVISFSFFWQIFLFFLIVLMGLKILQNIADFFYKLGFLKRSPCCCCESHSGHKRKCKLWQWNHQNDTHSKEKE
jgi:hypothetical protein